MRIVINYLKLKEDYNRLEVLHWGHVAFVFLAVILELFYGASLFGCLIKVGLLIGFYRLFFITKKELFYSFWSFSAILIIFLINRIFYSDIQVPEITLLYTIGLILLGIEIYILSSPIYYPNVSWWEYDFRYRTDLKINVSPLGGEATDARVTDLRRNAGCIASFEEFGAGDEITISSDKYFKEELKLEIVSKRIYSLGRPYNYGVRFLLTTDESKKSYSDLKDVWKNEALQSRQRKFTKKSSS